MACRLELFRLQRDKLGLEKDKIGLETELEKVRAQLRALTWQYMRTNGYVGVRGLLGDLLILGIGLKYSSICSCLACLVYGYQGASFPEVLIFNDILHPQLQNK